MLTTNPFDDDKLREECGVFGIWGADNAASFVALGLHALQHRGQEARRHHQLRRQAFPFAPRDGPCRRQFRPRRHHAQLAAARRSATCAIRPPAKRRCATSSRLFAELAEGGFAVAHNGNLSNAMKLRRTLNRRGSIFQSTSDTEVIIHLVATSDSPTTLDRLTDALKQVEGAYSLVVLTEEGLVACRDPLGIRPLVMGKLGEATIFASETVALDVDRRELPARRRAGRADPRQRQRDSLLPAVREGRAAAVHLRARLFLAARFHRRGHVGLRSPQEHRRRAVARSAGRRRLCRAGARQRRSRGDRLHPGLRHSVRARHHPLALCRADLHPAEPGSPPPRRQAEAQRQFARWSTARASCWSTIPSSAARPA